MKLTDISKLYRFHMKLTAISRITQAEGTHEMYLGLARTAFRAAFLRRSDTLAVVGSVELFCDEP